MGKKQLTNGTTTRVTTEPTGTQKASSGTSNITYEFKVKLSDLGAA